MVYLSRCKGVYFLRININKPCRPWWYASYSFILRIKPIWSESVNILLHIYAWNFTFGSVELSICSAFREVSEWKCDLQLLRLKRKHRLMLWHVRRRFEDIWLSSIWDSKNGLMRFFTVNRDLNWEALAQEQGITVPPEAGDMLKMAGNYLYTPKFNEWKLKIMGFQR